MSEYSPEFRELFSHVGLRLKAMRETQGLSLQDISARTRINLTFLQMIESGDLDSLPSLAFVKGFIRNFIQVLEISDDGLEEDLGRLNVMDSEDALQQLQPANKKLLDEEPSRLSFAKISIWSGLAMLILVAGFLLFRTPGDGGEGTPPGQSTQESRDVDKEAASPESTETSRELQPDGGEKGASETVADAVPPGDSAVPRLGGSPLEARKKLELTIRGLERTWVRLSLDRAQPIDVLMEPAETVGWQANQEIRLTIGKSNGVAVYLNGEEIILPQQKNKLIRELVLNKLTLLRLEN